jgi:PPOX class probable F420-dependent enzyme
MAKSIPEAFQNLLEKPSFAHLATVMPDGTPQVTPVWWEWDGKHVLVNSAAGRRKDGNMRLNAAVALSVLDPENPYRYLGIRGRVIECTEKGADEQIDRLANHYMGKDYPFRRPGEVRVTYRIEPTHVSTMG